MFFSDDGVAFHESFHKKCGDKGDWVKAFQYSIAGYMHLTSWSIRGDMYEFFDHYI